MKRLLLAALGLMFMASSASAQWVHRNKDDGGAYWYNSRDSREAHVLETHLFTEITNITLPVSHYIISPITGTITAVYAVIHKALVGANETVSVWASNATTGTFPIINEVTNGTTKLSLLQSGSAAGDTFVFTPNSATANKVSKGGRIAISNSGASTDDSAGTRASFTIIINPK